jgi:hypothetical protein
LNGKTRPRKQGTQGVLMNEMDTLMAVWMLGMQECGLPITLQQFKLKSGKTYSNPTKFKNGILKNKWWF